MRLLKIVALCAILLGCSPLAFPAPAPPRQIQVTFHVADVSRNQLRFIQIAVEGVRLGDLDNFRTAVQPTSLWKIQIDKSFGPIRVLNVEVVNDGLISLELTEALSASALSNHHNIKVFFDGNPSKGVLAADVVVNEPVFAKTKRLFSPSFNFSSDKKNANLDVSGSLQSGVGAKPQYQWSVTAKAPFEYNAPRWIFTFGPKFTGVANQETNADPDSLSASATTEFDFPYPRVRGKFVPVNLLFNPIDYEFERKIKQEAVLNNGKPVLNNYLQKNTNLIVSGQVQVVESWGQKKQGKNSWPVALNVNLGTELGSANSRSVLNQTSKPGYSDNPLRAVGGADLYFDLPNVGKSPLLTVDGHYTVRSIFHPEPFKQAGVNNGNEFYSTKARHYIAVNLARKIVMGSNLTVQYRYGSLPPTFTFIDHQVTIGFEVVLGK